MYLNVSSEFKSVNSGTGRTFRAKLIMSASGEEINAEIISLKLSGGNSSAEDLSFGDVSAAAAELEYSYVSELENKIKSDMTAAFFIGLLLPSGYEYVPMGEYKVLSCKRNGEKFSVNLADKLYGSDVSYTSALIYPNTADNLVSEICNNLGIKNFSANGAELSSLKFQSAPANITVRQMLSYIASYFGMNVYIDRNGAMAFGRHNFSSPVNITDDEVSEPTLGQNISITAIACLTANDTVLTSGKGRAMTFANPFMTKTQLDKLGSFLPINYSAAEINQLVGNILTDRYDVLKYKDSLIPVMSFELTFDGGVSVSFKSQGKTDDEAAEKTVTELDIVLEKVKRYADDAIKNTTDIMNGTNGGYKIEKYDADGNTYATLWMNAPDEKSATNCIMINKNGIGFGSKNAGAENWTFTQGWTIDGSFNTEYITSHNLSLTGRLTDGKRTNIDNNEIEMHYELSPDLKLYSKDGKTLDAVGLKAYSTQYGISNSSFYTNFGAFFDAAGESSSLDHIMSTIISILGDMNYFSNGGFRIKNGENEISGDPYGGLCATNGIYDNGKRCLTEETGLLNCMRYGYLSDCNKPSVAVTTKGRICVDVFNSGSANSPFSGSVGYLITFVYYTTVDYVLQIGIRYRDNQIKMRTYNKVNANSDGKTSAWSAWSNIFVTKDVTDALAQKDTDILNQTTALFDLIFNAFESKYYDDEPSQGYELSLSGCMTQWGKATVYKSGTNITFEKEYMDTNYGISITPFGLGANLWFTSPTKTGFRIYSSIDEVPVKWMTIGK